MTYQAERHRAELEQYRQIQAYYASIRRPWLERVTFAFALLASAAVALRRFGIGMSDDPHHGQWLTIAYWIAFILFVSLDSLCTRMQHPAPVPFGSLNPGRIYEKFAAEERAWQLLLVLMLPVTARFIAALLFYRSTH